MIDRRAFLHALALLALAPAALARRARAAADALDPKLSAALEQSPFVYVSPLRKDGKESTCHGEVWYGWLDGAVVLTTAVTTWKARSVKNGLDRARIWVGDYGRVKQLVDFGFELRASPRASRRRRQAGRATVVLFGFPDPTPNRRRRRTLAGSVERLFSEIVVEPSVDCAIGHDHIIATNPPNDRELEAGAKVVDRVRP